MGRNLWWRWWQTTKKATTVTKGHGERQSKSALGGDTDTGDDFKRQRRWWFRPAVAASQLVRLDLVGDKVKIGRFSVCLSLCSCVSVLSVKEIEGN